jgi:hypothetical protein
MAETLCGSGRSAPSARPEGTRAQYRVVTEGAFPSRRLWSLTDMVRVIEEREARQSGVLLVG